MEFQNTEQNLNFVQCCPLDLKLLILSNSLSRRLSELCSVCFVGLTAGYVYNNHQVFSALWKPLWTKFSRYFQLRWSSWRTKFTRWAKSPLWTRFSRCFQLRSVGVEKLWRNIFWISFVKSGADMVSSVLLRLSQLCWNDVFNFIENSLLNTRSQIHRSSEMTRWNSTAYSTLSKDQAPFHRLNEVQKVQKVLRYWKTKQKTLNLFYYKNFSNELQEPFYMINSIKRKGSVA